MILTVIQSKVIYILNLYASVNQIHAFLIPPKKRIVFLKPHNRSIDLHSEGNIDWADHYEKWANMVYHGNERALNLSQKQTL